MKIVASGDWHLDLKVKGYDFHSDIVRAAEEVIDATRGADLFVMLGDLFETQEPSPRAYAALFRLLGDVACPMLAVAGNHDYKAYAPLEEVTYNSELKVAYSPIAVGVLGKHFLLLPYGGEQKDIDSMVESVGGIDAAFAHLNMEGAELHEGMTSGVGGLMLPGQLKRVVYPVVNGHYHRRQHVGSVWMPGSLVPTDMGERGNERGWLELEL